MSHRRRIHHMESQSRNMTADDKQSRHAGEDALIWPPGTFIIVRRERKEFRYKEDVLADIKTKFPKAKIGKLLNHARFWVFQVRPEGVPLGPK